MNKGQKNSIYLIFCNIMSLQNTIIYVCILWSVYLLYSEQNQTITLM